MRRIIVIVLAVFVAGIVLTGLTGCNLFKSEKKAGQLFCPASGMLVKKEHSTEYKGKKIYFNAGECIKMFNKNPEKYMEVYRLVFGGANQRCPVSNDIIDPEYHTGYNSRIIYFHSEKDLKEFQANPEKYEKRIKDMERERLEAEEIVDFT
jgi:YHS domain-containing protein